MGCLSICMSVCLSVCMYVCMSVCLSTDHFNGSTFQCFLFSSHLRPGEKMCRCKSYVNLNLYKDTVTKFRNITRVKDL
jgi:hypothetical protein